MILDRDAEKTLKEWGIVHDALSAGASDLHLSVGSPPMVRVHGELLRMEHEPLTAEEIQYLVRLITDRYLMQRFFSEAGEDLDYTLEFPGLQRRFRVNIFRQYHGISIAMRVLLDKIQSFEELGLPRSFERLAFEKSGLVLVTGAGGAGKSTTLAAMVDLINRNQHRHIITIEDPIEVIFENKKSLVQQREVGTTVSGFAEAVHSAMREDPDVVLVGDIRDGPTAQETLRAAQIGALVLATLSTRSAVETIGRLLAMFKDDVRTGTRHQVADVLQGVMCQKLVPRKSGEGRVAAAEVLLGTTAVRHIIRDDRTHLLHSVMEIANADGMLTMEQSLLNLFHEGKVDLQTAFEHANDKYAFLSALDPEIRKELQIDWETEVEIKRLEQLRETRQRQATLRVL